MKMQSQKRTGRTNLINRSMPLLGAALLACLAGAAFAQPVESGPGGASSYALVVASHRGGPGQRDLRYAGRDARMVQDVLTQLGGYPGANVTTLVDPDSRALLGAMDAVTARLQAHAARGEQSQFLFYYSGHARSRVLNLGTEEIPLEELRRRLTSQPSTVTLAILDACQTGAISRVKGARPAQDFSYNSASDLNTAGVAVMASSSASELSQEAESLGASYFTHHLVVGLRGAADANEDRQVTLAEAYRYAYNSTLVSTAATAVGKQHVTLETRLRGKGEMVLTRPASWSAALELPASLSASVLVSRGADREVMAELTKVPGRPLRLALPAGPYEAIVRPGGAGHALRCRLALADQVTTPLSTAGCARVVERQVAAKGGLPDRPERFALEVGVGGIWSVDDSYNARLEDFGYQEQLFQFGNWISARASLAWAITPNISLVADYTLLDGGRYTKEVWDLQRTQQVKEFSWRAHGVGLSVRGTLPLLRGVVNPFLQAGGGLSIAATSLIDPLQASEQEDDQVQLGYLLSLAGGVHLMPWRHFGFFLQAGYTYAPAAQTLLGESHNSGGPLVHLGLRGAL